MAATPRNDSSRVRFGLIGDDRRGSRTGHESSTAEFNSITVEKRGLNPEVSQVKVRPAPPKPIVTNQTAPKPQRVD